MGAAPSGPTISPPNPPPNPPPKDALQAFLVIIGAIIALILAWFAVRTWYIDTHCTMILGTRICR